MAKKIGVLTGGGDTSALNAPDFVQFAESFGAIGLRVEDPSDFKPTFEKALALDKPVLMEVVK